MNLLFRLVAVVLAALFGRPLGLTEAGRLRLRVWPTDLDFNLHMTNARYHSVMDLGRIDLLVRSGLMRVMLKRRWTTVLGAVNVRFRRSLRPFQRFELVSRVLCWDEKWIFIEHRVETAAGTAAVAVMQGVFLAGGRPVPTDEVLEALGLPAKSPPMPDFVADWRPQSLPIEPAPAPRMAAE
ncbi:thioesterase family protein [Azospirillum sp.]|uniref:thioesterase family protein n=1 Tax=Azospirillum sp. TaxID=34012 RepID=UPI002D5889AB|nr:thioesterase family protein [Azospirillum sp.]HYD66864.1 thioesterase family protein [Azospirillum sp.]